MTPIAFTLTEADMVAGNRLAIRRSLRKLALRELLVVIAIPLGITMLTYAIQPKPFADVLMLFVKLLGVFIALAVVFTLVLIFLMPKQRARKNFRQMPALRRSQSVNWDATSITFTSDYGNASIPLADLHQWAADDEIVIIYPADHLFYMLPSRVFGDRRDWDSLIAALEASPVLRI